MKKGIFGILILIVLVQLASAMSININMKDSFGIGEEVFGDYSITGAGEKIKYTESLSCSSAPQPLLDLKEGTIPITENYELLSVTSDIESQICNFSVLIIEPQELIETKTFSIITEPLFQFEINACKDALCSKRAKIFSKGENIYLNYNSEIKEISVSGVLIYPGGKAEDIVFPTSIKASQIGTYELNVVAFKEGYKTITQEIQFGVISKEVDIDFLDGNTNFTWIIIGVIIIAIVGIFVYLLKKFSKR